MALSIGDLMIFKPTATLASFWAYHPNGQHACFAKKITAGNTDGHMLAHVSYDALGMFLGDIILNGSSGPYPLPMVYVYSLNLCVHASDNWHRVD